MLTSPPKPFTLSVPSAALDELHQRLVLTRLPDELTGANWDYGAPLADVSRLVARWREGFDWRAAERRINALPQFTRDIDVDGFGALNIHYVHQPSPVENAIPLLFVHGWPGHFLEVQKILPLLTAASPEHPSFHVVAPSLPGYGFSAAPDKPGFKMAQYAEVFDKLMRSLGYSEYVTQGGDWGYFITRKMSEVYGGQSMKAWHSNMALATPPTLVHSPLQWLIHQMTPYSSTEKACLERSRWFERWAQGYSAEQSTRPQTLGYALSDSPVGLLAWIYEKLVQWTDGYPWTPDEVLTWVSVYWFSRAGPAASVRIYYEAVNGGDFAPAKAGTPIPHGVSYFPKELQSFPKTWVRASHPNVVFEVEHTHGGHFAAFEQPVELVQDVRKMFGRGGPAYRAVEGKDGYERKERAKL